MKGQRIVNRIVNRYPTPDELYAIELAAKRARSQEMRRLLVSGARALKGLVARAMSALNAKRMHHA